MGNQGVDISRNVESDREAQEKRIADKEKEIRMNERKIEFKRLEIAEKEKEVRVLLKQGKEKDAERLLSEIDDMEKSKKVLESGVAVLKGQIRNIRELMDGGDLLKHQKDLEDIRAKEMKKMGDVDSIADHKNRMEENKTEAREGLDLLAGADEDEDPDKADRIQERLARLRIEAIDENLDGIKVPQGGIVVNRGAEHEEENDTSMAMAELLGDIND